MAGVVTPTDIITLTETGAFRLWQAGAGLPESREFATKQELEDFLDFQDN